MLVQVLKSWHSTAYLYVFLLFRLTSSCPAKHFAVKHLAKAEFMMKCCLSLSIRVSWFSQFKLVFVQFIAKCKEAQGTLIPKWNSWLWKAPAISCTSRPQSPLPGTLMNWYVNSWILSRDWGEFLLYCAPFPGSDCPVIDSLHIVSRTTRQSNLPHLPRVKTEMTKNSFCHNRCKNFNRYQ